MNNVFAFWQVVDMEQEQEEAEEALEARQQPPNVSLTVLNIKKCYIEARGDII